MSLLNYVKTNWVNKLTPLSPTNMNKIEQGIKDVTDEVIAHSADIVTVATANKILKLNGAAKLPTGITGDVNGVYLRNNAGALEWSTDNATWNAVGGAGIGSFEFGLPII